jgi:RNA polymerase sigma-70 factor (ECF subfamily)
MGNDLTSRTGSVLLVLLSDPEDPGAWEVFVDRYGPKIYRWCRQWRLQAADAENVTQDVLTKLVRKLRTFTYDPRKGKFRGWLKTLTHHAWRDYVESQTRAGVPAATAEVLERLQTLEAREDLLQTLAEAFDQEVLAEAMKRVKRQVSPRDWKIFEELALGHRRSREVAQELQTTVAAVLMAKGRVQKKLRAAIRHLEGASPGPPKEEP